MQRAIHLAIDLAGEHDDGDFATLVTAGVLDPALAERMATLAARQISARDFSPAVLVDLDVFLRSIENGAPARPLPLPPLGDHAKLPPGAQKSSVNVSGRVVTLVGRDGRAFVLVDDRPIGQPFDLPGVPMDAPEVERERDGVVHLRWGGRLRIDLDAEFSSVRLVE